MKTKTVLFTALLAAIIICIGISCSSSSEVVTPSMTLVLSFSGETATNVTLTYGSSSNVAVSTTLSATVSANKAYFTLSPSYADAYGYLKIHALKVYNGSTLLSATTTENTWFQFAEDQTITISYTLSSATSESITIEELSVSLPDDFIRGFDASYVDWYENDCNVTFSDTDGSEKDFFVILASHGVNTVRLRIWHDPSQFTASVNAGMNDLERTVRMAQRIAAAGLDLMLDFHYSDTWADPGRQIVPAAWKDLTSAEAVASALGSYTTDVLTALKNQANVTPKYVQIGNEINPGLLLHVASSSTNNDTHTDFVYKGQSWGDTVSNFTAYLKAGADAVRAFDESIKIVLHVASAGYEDWSWFFDPIQAADVPFDVIAYSYYPWESSHGTIEMLKRTLAFQKERYNVEVLVAECSAHWGDESAKSAQAYTYQHMKDPNTGALYTDLATATSGGVTYVTGTVQNQANVLRHIIEETALSGGIGVFAWGGDLYGNYKWGMFDASGVALQSLDVFKL